MPDAETEAAETEDDGEDRAAEAAEAMFENAGGEEAGADADGEVKEAREAKEEAAGGTGKATD